MLRNAPAAYGSVDHFLHWTIAVVFVGQIATGFLTQANAARMAVATINGTHARQPADR